MPEWGPLMETGIRVVDAQHQELVRRINELGVAMKKGKGREIVAELMSFLSRYADQHFATEERLMRESGYPDVGDHRARHAAFRREFNAHVEAFAANPTERSTILDIHGWMMTWLRDHVMYADLKLADHLREKGLL